MLEYLRCPSGFFFCNRVLGLIPYCVKWKVESHGSLIFLLVSTWQIYTDISFTCTKMSKRSILPHQLPKLPRRSDTGETELLRTALAGLSDFLPS